MAVKKRQPVQNQKPVIGDAYPLTEAILLCLDRSQTNKKTALQKLMNGLQAPMEEAA